jgi:hypothetical protein
MKYWNYQLSSIYKMLAKITNDIYSLWKKLKELQKPDTYEGPLLCHCSSTH